MEIFGFASRGILTIHYTAGFVDVHIYRCLQGKEALKRREVKPPAGTCPRQLPSCGSSASSSLHSVVPSVQSNSPAPPILKIKRRIIMKTIRVKGMHGQKKKRLTIFTYLPFTFFVIYLHFASKTRACCWHLFC
jgi:hypothetical protein